MANLIDITDLSDSTFDYIMEVAADDPEYAAELAASYADDADTDSWRYANSPAPTPTHDGIDAEGIAITDY